MNLLTDEIVKLFKRNPLYSHEEQKNPRILVKYFNPIGRGTWYVTEASLQENGDWICFGLCHIYEAELGYFSLNELQSIKLPYGITIERDLHFKGRLSDARKELEKLYDE